MTTTFQSKTIVTSLIAASALVLTACGGSDKTETKEAVKEAPVKVTQPVKKPEKPQKSEDFKKAEAPKKAKTPKPAVEVKQPDSLADIFMASKSSDRAPAVLMESVMNMQIWKNGSWSMDRTHVVFPPEGDPDITIKLKDAKGQDISSQKAHDRYRNQINAFAEGNYMPNQVKLNKGDYVLEFDIDGKTATKVPFSVVSNGGGDDPFGEGESLRYEGPWQKLGLLFFEKTRNFKTGADNYQVKVMNWVGMGDTQPGKDSARLQAKLMQGKTLIAHSKETQGFASTDRPFKIDKLALYHPHERARMNEAKSYTIGDLVAKDTNYRLNVERQEDGEILRSFDIKIKKGKLIPLDRTQLGFNPRHEYLAPRIRGFNNNRYEFLPVHWMEAR